MDPSLKNPKRSPYSDPGLDRRAGDTEGGGAEGLAKLGAAGAAIVLTNARYNLIDEHLPTVLKALAVWIPLCVNRFFWIIIIFISLNFLKGIAELWLCYPNNS